MFVSLIVLFLLCVVNFLTGRLLLNTAKESESDL